MRPSAAPRTSATRQPALYECAEAAAFQAQAATLRKEAAELENALIAERRALEPAKSVAVPTATTTAPTLRTRSTLAGQLLSTSWELKDDGAAYATFEDNGGHVVAQAEGTWSVRDSRRGGIGVKIRLYARGRVDGRIVSTVANFDALRPEDARDARELSTDARRRRPRGREGGGASQTGRGVGLRRGAAAVLAGAEHGKSGEPLRRPGAHDVAAARARAAPAFVIASERPRPPERAYDKNTRARRRSRKGANRPSSAASRSWSPLLATCASTASRRCWASRGRRRRAPYCAARPTSSTGRPRRRRSRAAGRAAARAASLHDSPDVHTARHARPSKNSSQSPLLVYTPCCP